MICENANTLACDGETLKSVSTFAKVVRKVKNRRQNLAWGAATGAPPPLVRYTATPVVVTGWEVESGKLPWGHRHYVYGGTATPRAVPT